MKRIIVATMLAFALASGLSAQTQSPPQPRKVDLQDPVIQKLLTAIEELNKVVAELKGSIPPPQPTAIHVPAGSSIDSVLKTAPDGATITLEPGALYQGSFVVTKPVKIVTRGWNVGDRMVTPSDVSQMATIQGTVGQNYGIWVKANNVILQGFQVLYNPDIGQGEMIRVGDSTDADITHVPDNTQILQLLLQGNKGDVYGQKRAIGVTGKNTLIDQVWCQDIWINGQDSQCVASWSAPGPITIRRSFLSAGSENVLIGGSPPAGPAFVPTNITLEDSILIKPMKWKTATAPHIVKNLFELKFGRNVTVRRNWMQHNWPQAQPGYSVVVTVATNGPCGYCDIQNFLFEDNVVTDVSGGINILGYVYSAAPGSGQAVGLTFRNNLFYISKAQWGSDGRPIQMGAEPKDILIERNTFIYDGNSFINMYYGSKWPYQQPPLTAKVLGGPITGVKYLRNVTTNNSYGIFTPAGSNGVSVTTAFPGIVIGGNVIAGAGGTAMSNYNATSTEPNLNPTVAEFKTFFMDWDNKNFCGRQGTILDGKGADCSRLPLQLQKMIPPEQLTAPVRRRNRK